jgi:hypothetical protein
MITAVVLLGMVPSARAVDVVFSADLQSTENPTVYANVGDRVSVWMLAKTSGTNGYVNTVSLNIRAVGLDGGAIHYPFVGIDNPYNGGDPKQVSSYRWDGTTVVDYDSGGLVVQDALARSTSYRPELSIEQGWRILGNFDFTVGHEGTVKFYLQVGDYGLSETGGVTTNRLGWNDGPVANVAGAESALADLTVISPMPPLPEPGALGVIGVAGVVAMGRRRA